MGMKMRVELAAGIMLVAGDAKIAGLALNPLPEPLVAGRCVTLINFEHLRDRLFMGISEPFIATDDRADRNRFRRGDHVVIDVHGIPDNLTVLDPVRTLSTP